MDIFMVIYGGLVVLAFFINPIVVYLDKRNAVKGRGFSPDQTNVNDLTKSSDDSGKKVLLGFAVITAITGVITIIKFGKIILQNGDLLLSGFWLFLFMLAGMFVQVISSNYKNGNTLFKVSASQLIYPMLFSIIIFYPIWTLASDNKFSITYFLIYSAFLNGYFWEAIVSNIKKPE